VETVIERLVAWCRGSSTRLLTGEDISGPWVVVQPGTYRYSVRMWEV